MDPFLNLESSNDFHTLGNVFSSEVQPRGFSNPVQVAVNKDFAKELGLDEETLKSPEFLQLCTT